MINRKLAEIVKDQTPLMLPKAATIQEACRCMCDCCSGSVLVVDDEQHLAGIFTARDAVRALAESKQAETVTLEQVMTPNPITIAPECRAIDALHEMNNRGFRHLPVVDSGRILGVISRSDFKGVEIDRLDDEEYLWQNIR